MKPSASVLKSAGEIVREAVLELTYTSHDMAPFARDMGYIDEAGEVRPPFPWDMARRLQLRAKLDAVFFYLYGVTNRDDIRYIYSTFPIVEREEMAAHGGVYRSCKLLPGLHERSCQWKSRRAGAVVMPFASDGLSGRTPIVQLIHLNTPIKVIIRGKTYFSSKIAQVATAGPAGRLRHRCALPGPRRR